MNVHLVDPDDAARSTLKRFLEMRGVRVTESADLSSAAADLAGCAPAVVVTEVDGPVTRTVDRLRRAAPGVPVMVWTSADDGSIRREARLLGCAFARKNAPASEVAFELARAALDRSPAAVPNPPDFDVSIRRPLRRRDAPAV